MVFNSVEFLFFFPFVACIYFIIPQKTKNYWLLFASAFFYMMWNPQYILLMYISIIVTYICGVRIYCANIIENERRRKRGKKFWLLNGLIINLAILGLFKYFDFFIENINVLFHKMGFSILEKSWTLLLPVGISFYTFQALGYIIDIYLGKIQAEKNFPRYALFVSFFPQLVAGPIERSENLLKQFMQEHKFEYERVKNGLLLVVWGLFQKIVIADRIAIFVNAVYGASETYNGTLLLIATFLFAFQVYCDFSGYTDMAIGCAQILGFTLMDNFKTPYFSVSIKEFWRRWHISLSNWLKDYIYIPLGGNRCLKGRNYFNIMITFCISGLWHGAEWTYIIWGGYTASIR